MEDMNYLGMKEIFHLVVLKIDMQLHKTTTNKKQVQA